MTVEVSDFAHAAVYRRGPGRGVLYGQAQVVIACEAAARVGDPDRYATGREPEEAVRSAAGAIVCNSPDYPLLDVRGFEDALEEEDVLLARYVRRYVPLSVAACARLRLADPLPEPTAPVGGPVRR